MENNRDRLEDWKIEDLTERLIDREKQADRWRQAER